MQINDVIDDINSLEFNETDKSGTIYSYKFKDRQKTFNFIKEMCKINDPSIEEIELETEIDPSIDYMDYIHESLHFENDVEFEDFSNEFGVVRE